MGANRADRLRSTGDRSVVEGAGPDRTRPFRRPPHSDLLGLQRRAGNRAVLAALGAQASLQVGAVDDPLERDADRVAEEVLRRLQAPPQTVADDPGAATAVARSIRRRPSPATHGVGPAGGEVDADLHARLTGELGRGTPLGGHVRREMEGAFGADFSSVRIHQGPAASELSDRLGATAFTLGRDIFFRDAPDASSTAGRRLLAHELAHTVQQDASPVQRSIRRAPGPDGDEESEPAEPEPEGAAGAIGEGEIEETEEAIDGPPPGIEADRSGPVAPVAGSPGRRPRHGTGAAGGSVRRYRINVASAGVGATITQSTGLPEGHEADAIAAAPKVSTSIGTHKEDDPFGALSRRWKTKSVSFDLGKDAKNPSVTLKPSFLLKTTWGVTSGGAKDVSSASSSRVKADTYEQIVHDLTPELVEKSWVAPRDVYWSKKLCERHEKYHATDVTTWAKGQGLQFVQDYLGKQTVALTDDERSSKSKMKAKLKPIVKDAQDALQVATNTYMRGTGNTYYSYPGEERAFGDGRQPYLDLAAAVKERGEKLKAAKDEKERKKAAKSDAKTTTAGEGSGT